MSGHESDPCTEVAIIGGGPSGLALSDPLRALDCDHVVLEQGRVAEYWRTRRWDSLRLVAPNGHFGLPGLPYSGDDPDGFMGRDEVVARLEGYALTFALPLRRGVQVAAITPHPGGPGFQLATSVGPVAARQVVIAAGDAAAADFCAAVDGHVRVSGAAAPLEQPPRFAEADAAAPATTLDIAAAAITALIWATGYRPDIAWLKLSACDAQGDPIARQGVSAYRGRYFLRLEWRHGAQSYIFPGLAQDAACLAPISAARAQRD